MTMSDRPSRLFEFLGYVLLALGLVGLVVVLFGGCTTTGAARAAVAREAQVPHFHPAQALAPLQAFQRAVILQAGEGGMEPEQLALIMRWIGVVTTTLQGPHADEWEAAARPEWNAVKSAVGPFEHLRPWVDLIDSLLQ